MDTVDNMALILFENDVDLTDDDAVTRALKSAGFNQSVINVFMDEAIAEADGMAESAVLDAA